MAINGNNGIVVSRHGFSPSIYLPTGAAAPPD